MNLIKSEYLYAFDYFLEHLLFLVWGIMFLESSSHVALLTVKRLGNKENLTKIINKGWFADELLYKKKDEFLFLSEILICEN